MLTQTQMSHTDYCWQYPLLQFYSFSPVGLWFSKVKWYDYDYENVCVHVLCVHSDGINLKCPLRWHVHYASAQPHACTHILIPSEDCELTDLKVKLKKWRYCPIVKIISGVSFSFRNYNLYTIVSEKLVIQNSKEMVRNSWDILFIPKSYIFYKPF